MNGRPHFGKRPEATRTESIHEMAITALQVSRDMGHTATSEVCVRVIAQLRTGRTPLLSDVRSISLALKSYFR